MAKSYFKNHPVQSGVAVGVILLFISSTGITAWLQNIAWWTATKNVISAIWNAIVWFMTINIPLWGILLFLMLFIAILCVWLRVYYATHSTAQPEKKEEQMPQYLKYTSDTIEQVKFEWEYEKTADGKYVVRNLTIICPDCGTSLRPYPHNYDYYKCPRCNKTLSRYDRGRTIIKPLEDVKAVIYDNIKRNIYKI